MMNEASENQLKTALDAMVEEENLERLRSEGKLQRHRLGSFSLHKEDFQTVKVQLRALGLIAKSEKPRSVKGSGTYWTLTPYGARSGHRRHQIRRPLPGAQKRPA
jgi:hypothetical protein